MVQNEISGSAAGNHLPAQRTPSRLPAGTHHRRRTARLQIQDLVEGFTSSSETLSQFAVQLFLDPAITAFKFVRSLHFESHEIQLNMFVAYLEGNHRVAFDVVSERPLWDTEHDGLVLLALEHQGIRLVEIDHAHINAEPFSSNCKRIWSHLDHPVPPPLEKAINSALATHRKLTVRSLGTAVGLRDPIPEISALVCQQTLLIDLSMTFGPNSIVRRASDLRDPPSLFSGSSKRFGKAAP
jgi:hypothetical protein